MSEPQAIIHRLSLLKTTFLVLAAWGVALLLAFTSIEHIRNQWTFLNAIYRYQMFGGVPVAIIAVVFPVAQLTSATMIASKPWRVAGLMFAAVLFFCFAIVQLTALLRGLNIACGCFGSFSETISWKTIGLDIVLFLTAISLSLLNPSCERLK